MRIAICEDHQDDRTYLKQLITRYCQTQGLEVEIDEFSSGEALLEAFETQRFALLFLDVYMQQLNGLQTAAAIRQMDAECLLVFVTTSREHAIEGFVVKALHYLIKPITEEQVNEVFQRCKPLLQENMKCLEILANRIPVKIPLKGIHYIEVYDKTCFIHMEQELVKTYTSLDEIDQQLDKPVFLRCHRSYIVNMRYIVNVGDNDFLLHTGVRIPISKAKKQVIKQQYLHFLFSAAREEQYVY